MPNPLLEALMRLSANQNWDVPGQGPVPNPGADYADTSPNQVSPEQAAAEHQRFLGLQNNFQQPQPGGPATPYSDHDQFLRQKQSRAQ